MSNGSLPALTDEEIQRAIDLARKLLVRGDTCEPFDPWDISEDAQTLGVRGEPGIIAALRTCVAELTPESYAGARPRPMVAYEPICQSAELWIFVWESPSIGCEVYLKFCFVQGDRLMILVSFKKSSPASKTK